MKITKFGHASLLIEDRNSALLIDPGSYSSGEEAIAQLDIVWLTHSHTDHCDIVKLRELKKAHPKLTIFTNPTLARDLKKNEIEARAVETGQVFEQAGFTLQAIGTTHAPLYASLPPIDNVGCLVNHRFLYPGDNLTPIDQPVEILALPVAGPWLKLSEAIDYAIALKPTVCFPVHDGILKQPGTTNRIPGDILPRHGIEWKILELTLPNER